MQRGGDVAGDDRTALFRVDVIEIPLDDPSKSRIISSPTVFADPESGRIAGLWQGGDHGKGSQTTARTDHCHDITVFPSRKLAGGACSGNGLIFDISNPLEPKRIDAVGDPGFAYWHSATFNNDGTKVLFTDEWGGGGRPRCRAVDPLTWGADAIYDIVDNRLVHKGYYKMPAAQTEQENCVAHNGSLIPIPGRDIMVQSWYQGGVSVFDFTDSANPVEIAFFDRGPIDGEKLVSGGYWSSYWYNGNIYAAEISRGLDIFRLLPSNYLSQNELDAAALVRWDEFNSQNQPKVSWPASVVVARAYLDQLARSNAVAAPRAATIRATLDRADQVTARDKGARQRHGARGLFHHEHRNDRLQIEHGKQVFGFAGHGATTFKTIELSGDYSLASLLSSKKATVEVPSEAPSQAAAFAPCQRRPFV